MQALTLRILWREEHNNNFLGEKPLIVVIDFKVCRPVHVNMKSTSSLVPRRSSQTSVGHHSSQVSTSTPIVRDMGKPRASQRLNCTNIGN